jgi:hypothetical protein
MRFEKHDLAEGAKIPRAALKLCGFEPEQSAEYHVLEDAVVVLKKRMNASELIRASWTLQQLAIDLCTHLALQCCPCMDCEDCSDDGESCPYDALDFALNFDIPDELRELAGIPKDAPVHAELLDDGEITISVNHDGPGLWDIPAPMMQGLLAAHICPSALEGMLESGEIVYGA